MSVVERPAKTMTEQAVDAMASFEPMIEMVIEYGNLTVAEDGIGKIEEAHKAVKRLRVDLDKKRKELNEGALHYQRTVNATAKTLTERISVVEERLEKERAIHDAEKLREKQAKEAAKAAVLNERVGRLSAAGAHVTDLKMIEGMAADEFEFFFAKESRIAAEAKAEAELKQKIAIRTARLEALGVACPSPEQIGTLSDAQFEHDYKIAKTLIERSNAALKAEQEAEAKRQAEELRIRAEEIENQRLIDEAALKAQREAMEADRAEMRRQQEEIAKQQAELRAKAEAEANEKRRLERAAEQARREAATAPELEKLESVLDAIRDAAGKAVVNCGEPAWCVHLDEALTKLASDMRLVVRNSI